MTVRLYPDEVIGFNYFPLTDDLLQWIISFGRYRTLERLALVTQQKDLPTDFGLLISQARQFRVTDAKLPLIDIALKISRRFDSLLRFQRRNPRQAAAQHH